MNCKLHKLITLFTLLFLLTTQVYAGNQELSKAIQEQVSSASNCVVLAYEVILEYTDADEIFKNCIEARAVLIARHLKYGPGKYGKINVIDKIEGYSHLADSKNGLVAKEADRFSTAAGDEE